LFEEILTFLYNIIKLPGFMPAVLGALTGAIVSFIPLYFIQNRAFKKDEKIRASEYNRSQQAMRKTLIIKLLKINADISNIHQHIEESFHHFSDFKGKIEPWGILKPLSLIPDKISISFDELGMLLGLGDFDRFQKVCNMEADHKFVLGAAKEYRKLREELFKNLPPLSNVDGTLGMYRDSNNVSPELKLKMEEINEFIGIWRKKSTKYATESKQTLDELIKLLESKLDIHQRKEFNS